MRLGRRVGIAVAAALGTVVIVGASWVTQQQSTNTVVWNAQSWMFTFDGPSEGTPDDLEALLDALAKDDPVPAGFTIDDWKGKCTGTVTGVSVGGDFQLIVTIVDEIADVNSATVTVNGTDVHTATRNNGGIIDRGEYVIATFSLLITPTLPMEIEAVWWANDGEAVKQKLSALP